MLDDFNVPHTDPGELYDVVRSGDRSMLAVCLLSASLRKTCRRKSPRRRKTTSPTRPVCPTGLQGARAISLSYLADQALIAAKTAEKKVLEEQIVAKTQEGL